MPGQQLFGRLSKVAVEQGCKALVGARYLGLFIRLEDGPERPFGKSPQHANVAA